jgi:hypothetical protein
MRLTSHCADPRSARSDIFPAVACAQPPRGTGIVGLLLLLELRVRARESLARAVPGQPGFGLVERHRKISREPVMGRADLAQRPGNIVDRQRLRLEPCAVRAFFDSSMD